MAQDRISIDGFSEVQPGTFDWSFETTSTQDSARAMNGKAVITPMFTTESFSVEYGELTAAQTAVILRAIVQRPGKPFFSLHYYSPYYQVWRTADFYVGKGTLKVKTLVRGKERISSVSCNFVGRNKLV